MASARKIQKVFEAEISHSLPDRTISDLSTALDKLCSTELTKNITLRPFKILNSNAADRFSGVPFSKAYFELEHHEKGFMLGDVFRRGLEIGTNYLEGKVPTTKHEQIVLNKLAQYLTTDADVKFHLEDITDLELTKVLANHLFGKLSTSSCYTIDKKCKGKGEGVNMAKCSCSRESCILTGKFGDTSIGNPQVWHGNIDIIVEGNLIIDIIDDDPNSPGGKSPVELSHNPQLVAESIVFSFIQKRMHPERTSFLTPCVGVGSKSMLLMLYDSENDVLLQSSLVPLTQAGKFSMQAILLAWLAVNYKVLCTGLTEEMITYKANFFNQATEKLSIYENELTLENVESLTNDNIMPPNEWSYNSFLLSQHNKIEELRRKRALKYFKEDNS